MGIALFTNRSVTTVQDTEMMQHATWHSNTFESALWN